MKRILVGAMFAGLLALGWNWSSEAAEMVSGQGAYKFRVLYTSSILPAKAQEVLEKAHGGFAVDRRTGKGETFFALPGAGILRIGADLKTVELLDTDASMRDTNLHNSTLWFDRAGKGFLVFPGNQSNRVYTTTMDGKLLDTIEPPTDKVKFSEAKVATYFREGGPFVPTDVEYLDGTYYIATGYSKLDYVLMARVMGTSPFRTAWTRKAFGGKGEGVGQFGTGHGITVPPGKKRIDVADRPNAEIDRFTPAGKYIDTVKTPPGSFPCDIDYEGRFGVIGSLNHPDKTKGAPVYLLEGDKIVSTILPKEELGLEKFMHIHNATMRTVDGKIYLIVQAWNPGDFAILEQVL
ncbi:MAG: hypothetical protein H6509_08760 [Bryobacterales bacterium]|nr:hypothetical protein [Acidobacteriota bacterium]MCB9384693.1 hypothetical protein [Bryobacterales bacterium]